MAAIRSIDWLAGKLQADFVLVPVMATEIEFYLHGAAAAGIQKSQIVALISEACITADVPLARADAEIGYDQYEISLPTSRDLPRLAQDTIRFKQVMAETFAPRGIRADFSAKPDAAQPGSGLHVHLHLEDNAGKNVFTRAGDEMLDPFSSPLLYSLGGMLALMNPCMRYFAPTEDSYARFAPKSNAPLTVSWGTNNRTVALRLPTKALDNKHIEHRVAGSDADVAHVMTAVLAGAHYGLKNKIPAGEAIYGDAALPQYRLPKLAATLQEAEQYAASALLNDYIA